MAQRDQPNDKKPRRFHPLQISDMMKLFLSLSVVVTILILFLLPSIMHFLSLLKPLIIKKTWDALSFLAITTAISVCIMRSTPIGSIPSEEIHRGHKQEKLGDNDRSKTTSEKEMRKGKEVLSSSTYSLQQYDKNWQQCPGDDRFSFDLSKPSSSRLQNKLVNEKEMIMDKASTPIIAAGSKMENGLSRTSKQKRHKRKEDSHHNIAAHNTRSELIHTTELQKPNQKMIPGLMKSSVFTKDDATTSVIQDGTPASYHRSSSLLASSKHSVSALNLAEFNELIEGKANRSRSSRRKTSQSYDFTNDEWTFKEPPPPPPYIFQDMAGCTCNMNSDCPHKLYSTLDDLLPWRTKISDPDSGSMQEGAEYEDIADSSCSSVPCALPRDQASSPHLLRSRSELNRKVSEYIDKVYGDLLIQRQLSIQQRKNKAPSNEM